MSRKIGTLFIMLFAATMLIMATSSAAKEGAVKPESLVTEGATYTVCTPKGFAYQFVDTGLEKCLVPNNTKIEVLSSNDGLAMVRLTAPEVPDLITAKKPRFENCPVGVRIAHTKSFEKQLLRQQRCQPEPVPENE